MSNIKKTALIITIISLGSKFLGFLREVALAYFYGTSYVVDAYLMAVAIPSIVFGWITSLSVSYTPIYTDVRVKLGEDKSVKFTNNLISIAITISFACALLGLIFSKQLVNIAAPGFKGQVYDLTNWFVKISVFSTIFNVFAQILVSYLNCNDKFIQSNISTLVISSTQLLVIYLSSKLGNNVLIFGTVMSSLVQLIVLYVFSLRNGYRFKYELKITSEIKQAFVILVPLFISSMLAQINNFVNKAFASGLGEGSVSALNYSMVIRTFIFYVFTIAITTMIYPMLSKSMAENDIKTVKSTISKSVDIIILLFVPITIGAFLLSEPAVSFIYERGVFSRESTIMTSMALQMYSLGLVALALREVITKVFYSMQDTKSTMYISVFTVGLCVLFSAILIKPMGHVGLALASSLAETLTIPLFFYFLRKRLGSLGMKNSLNILIKSSISSAVMGVVVYFVFKYSSMVLSGGKLYILLSMIISAVAGGLVYFVLMVIMKVKEMDFFTDIIKNIWHKIFKNRKV